MAGPSQLNSMPVIGSAPYFMTINPSQTVPGSNIRQIRERFVDDLVQEIVTNGWRDTYPIVYEPVPRQLLQTMTPEEVDNLTFKIMDGAHRMMALKRLQRDPSVPAFSASYKVHVRVVREPDIVGRTIGAHRENVNTKVQNARKTFCDDLWARIPIKSSVLDRVLAFSTAIATPLFSTNPDIVRKKKAKKEALQEIENVPCEAAAFLKAYEARIFNALTSMSDDGTRCIRRTFDPSTDMHLLTPSTILAMVSDAIPFDVPKDNPVSDYEQTKVKWRFLQYILPFPVYLVSTSNNGSESVLGGAGIVRVPGRDTRLWDYMCIVNNTITSSSKDKLSYRRMYNKYLYNQAWKDVFCGLLMMISLVQSEDYAEEDEAEQEGRRAGRKRRRTTSQPGPALTAADLCQAVCALFRQYNSAARLLPNCSGLDNLLGPVLRMNRESLNFEVISESGIWSSPEEVSGFTGSWQSLAVHPAYNKPYAELTIAERGKDREVKSLAKNLLQDLEQLRRDTASSLEKRYGSFLHTETVLDGLRISQLCVHVTSHFSAMRTHGFADAVQAESSSHQDDGAREITEENVPSRDTARKSGQTEVPPVDSTAARAAAETALNTSDGVHMTCSSFDDWSRTEECRVLTNRVALVLTDPPYNTRRVQGSANSEYDKLSSTDMSRAADLIALLLRPNGQAYIFCSFTQWAEWRAALSDAGGGNVLRVSSVPEVIVRHPTSLQSGNGVFAYHRRNAVEFAIHAYKRDSSGEGATAYADAVAWGRRNVDLLPGSSMPSFVAAIDGYEPPAGAELLRSGSHAVRAEQKSVKLLRNIMRLFAPRSTDIVVDLFAGTMSTVAAALLEGHPVHAVELDRICFDIGSERIRALQYRRGAAGLIPSLTASEVDALTSHVANMGVAADPVDEE